MSDFERWLPKLKEYAKLLSERDDRIYEIVLFGSLVNEKFHPLSDIDIVCLFDPAFDDPEVGHRIVRKLVQEMRRIQLQMGIHHPIDLGFMHRSAICMSKGQAVAKDYLTLYSDEETIKKEGFLTFHERIKMNSEDWGKGMV